MPSRSSCDIYAFVKWMFKCTFKFHSFVSFAACSYGFSCCLAIVRFWARVAVRCDTWCTCTCIKHDVNIQINLHRGLESKAWSNWSYSINFCWHSTWSFQSQRDFRVRTTALRRTDWLFRSRTFPPSSNVTNFSWYLKAHTDHVAAAHSCRSGSRVSVQVKHQNEGEKCDV